jgi:ATP-dependent Lon protease
MPGRIIREIRRAGSNNPLFMFDEVDKIGQDVRGDPMSALLEVLDPAQNSTFSDHYLSVPFDLSRVLFITTANYTSAIQPALRDRMEMIELPGYTQREKLMIARRHLLPRQIDENGLTPEQIKLPDDVILTIISDYTREAGVRTLERKIGAVCRARAAAVVRGTVSKPTVTLEGLRDILGPQQFESEVAATTPVPGVVTGLAFTATGGEILFIEATKMPGSGQLKLTGQLGDVMRESAVAATSIIRMRLADWNIRPQQYQSQDYHIHVPAGATPKDGPSAGVAMLIALTSALTDTAIAPTIGMTGEITLSGRVLPVGGIREKVLAAHRAGITRIIMPARNQHDLDEIPEDIRAQITFVFVTSIDEVLREVFPKEKRRTTPRAESKSAKTRKKRPTKKKSAKRTRKKKTTVRAKRTSARSR